MERLEFASIEDFVEDIMVECDDVFDENAVCEVSIVAKYKEAIQIVNELVRRGYNLHTVTLKPEGYGENYDEYLISIEYDDDSDCRIYVEPMRRDYGVYIAVQDTTTYIMDNCSSRCLHFIDSRDIYEVGFEEDDCDSCDLDTSEGTSTSVNVSRNKDGTPQGFTRNESFYDNGIHYSSSFSYFSDDVDFLRNMADVFKIKL